MNLVVGLVDQSLGWLTLAASIVAIAISAAALKIAQKSWRSSEAAIHLDQKFKARAAIKVAEYNYSNLCDSCRAVRKAFEDNQPRTLTLKPTSFNHTRTSKLFDIAPEIRQADEIQRQGRMILQGLASKARNIESMSVDELARFSVEAEDKALEVRRLSENLRTS